MFSNCAKQNLSSLFNDGIPECSVAGNPNLAAQMQQVERQTQQFIAIIRTMTPDAVITIPVGGACSL